MQPFNLLTLPLKGRQLIEASAGTGKTYSLALLYLRLILERGLELEQILVVTFTKAATEELRSRIRLRLRQAMDQLEGEDGAAEDMLTALIAALPDRDAAAQRLADTLTRMDDAAIFTIHGFCQRMLQDQAFEAGAPFGVEFIESERLLRQEIVEDFWRQRFYPAPPEEAEWAGSVWHGPAELLARLRPFLSRPEISFVPAVSAGQLQQLRADAECLWQEARSAWHRGQAEVTWILEHDPCLSRDRSKGYGKEPLANTLEAMQRLAVAEKMPWLLPPGAELLADTEMALRLKGKKIQPQHPFFTRYGAWYRQHLRFEQAAQAHTLAEAYRFLRKELSSRKQEQGVLYFDDQLNLLATALARPGGRQLANRIRGRFRVALVDEFQDTDSLQYRIFQTLFGGEEEPGLFMIGDPKQSIYSFRGADIFAYIRAQQATAARASYTMDTNFRSSQAMVQAVNRLFARRPYFVFPEIVFHPVRSGAASAKEAFLVQGEAPLPLQVQLLSGDLAAAGKGRIAKDRAAAAAAGWTAREIGRLLHLGRRGMATLDGKSLGGGDLAVLVRTHREAELIRRELQRLNIASVYFSQDSVFTTDEAGQLFHLLTALLDLADETLVCNALVTDFFGLDAVGLSALRADPVRWGEMVAELAEYHQRWDRAGIMAMFHLVLQRRRIVPRLLAQPGGERKLTNFLHLAELLQEASGRQQMDELVRWFNEQRTAPEPELSSQQLRLESDADLVKIVTIHKAKGLEYPVVFLPFLWSARQVQQREMFPFHGHDGSLHLDLGSGEVENFRQAERERLAEDLRLLYVAMTRGKYCTYFCWGPISSIEQSALAWLLHPDWTGEGGKSSLPQEQIRADLAEVDGGEGLVNPLLWSEHMAEEPRQPAVRPELPGPGQFAGQIDTSWSVTSYSRLAVGAAQELAKRERETPLPGVAGNEPSMFNFPRGAAAGTFLHAALEQLDFPDPDGLDLETVADLLRRSGLAPHWAPLVRDWLRQVVETPLTVDGDLRLQVLSREDRLVEMGFYFGLNGLEPAGLNALLDQYGLAPLEAQQERLRGLMKGYVDLVFRYQGQYFVVDYKSNYLGATVEDYGQERMRLAMDEHRYDLQYLIYILALHRYLACRLPGYDYDRDVGGVFYLFLRGMRPERGPTSGVWYAKPPRGLIEALDRACGRGEGR